MSMPLIGGYQDDAYSVFLADLNNFLNDYSYHGQVPSYQQFKRGEVRSKFLFSYTILICQNLTVNLNNRFCHICQDLRIKACKVLSFLELS